MDTCYLKYQNKIKCSYLINNLFVIVHVTLFMCINNKTEVVRFNYLKKYSGWRTSHNGAGEFFILRNFFYLVKKSYWKSTINLNDYLEHLLSMVVI